MRLFKSTLRLCQTRSWLKRAAPSVSAQEAYLGGRCFYLLCRDRRLCYGLGTLPSRVSMNAQRKAPVQHWPCYNTQCSRCMQWLASGSSQARKSIWLCRLRRRMTGGWPRCLAKLARHLDWLAFQVTLLSAATMRSSLLVYRIPLGRKCLGGSYTLPRRICGEARAREAILRVQCDASVRSPGPGYLHPSLGQPT